MGYRSCLRWERLDFLTANRHTLHDGLVALDENIKD